MHSSVAIALDEFGDIAANFAFIGSGADYLLAAAPALLMYCLLQRLCASSRSQNRVQFPLSRHDSAHISVLRMTAAQLCTAQTSSRHIRRNTEQLDRSKERSFQRQIET